MSSGHHLFFDNDWRFGDVTATLLQPVVCWMAQMIDFDLPDGVLALRISAHKFDQIFHAIENLDPMLFLSGLFEDSTLDKLKDTLQGFRRWDLYSQGPDCLDGRQPITDGIRALVTRKMQEVAGNRKCQRLLSILLAKMETILRGWMRRWERGEEKVAWEYFEDWKRLSWQEQPDDLYLDDFPRWKDEVLQKLNQLVDEYERERTVEEERKNGCDKKEKFEWVVDSSCRQHIGGPTSCDRRFSHDIPPDLPSTLFESDFCSSTVAILRTALLRVYKGHRLLYLEAA